MRTRRLGTKKKNARALPVPRLTTLRRLLAVRGQSLVMWCAAAGIQRSVIYAVARAGRVTDAMAERVGRDLGVTPDEARKILLGSS